MQPKPFQRSVAGFLLLAYLNLAVPILPGMWAASLPADPPPPSAAGELPKLDAPAVQPPADLATPVRTPSTVKVNRQVPVVSAPDFRPRFSAQPTMEEFLAVRIFREPLQPTAADSSPEELTALAAAITTYAARQETNDVSALLPFLEKFPDSAWQTSLLTNVGLSYFQEGYFSKAFSAWEKAWTAACAPQDKTIRQIGGRAYAELLGLNARVGRQQRLEELLKDNDGMEFAGAVGEKIRSITEALAVMKSQPEISFKCGPYAVGNLLSAKGSATPESKAKIHKFASTAEGTSLAQVNQLARDVGLSYQVAKRIPGAKILLPAVVHWKIGHYASIVSETRPGYYLVKDPTFGLDLVISRDAIDQEASGYFLVPKGTLPAGWSAVGEKEAGKIFGRGLITNRTDDQLDQDQTKVKPDCVGKGMPSYNVHAMLTSLTVNDVPVGYQPPVGPGVDFQITHLQRDTALTSLNFSNLGIMWTHNWLSYVQIVNTTDANVFLRGGGVKSFTNFNSTANQYDVQRDSRNVLAKVMQGAATTYEMSAPDGSKEVFGLFDGTRYFLTKQFDPIGNAVTINYDGSFRISSIVDALNQVTTFSYGNVTDPKKITVVTDPFGRSASFNYRSDGLLTTVTDVAGLVSSFEYDLTGLKYMTAMVTPYGRTQFSYKYANPGAGDSDTWIEVNLPDGSKERTWFKATASTVVATETTTPSSPYAFNNYLQYRNVFFWGRKAYYESMAASGNLDEPKADIYHFLHEQSGKLSNILESIKRPNETRVWFGYPGQASLIYANDGMQASPASVARMVDDPETGSLVEQVSKYEYNTFGRVTKVTDPRGRETSLAYAANGLDLLTIKQKNGAVYDVLASALYSGPAHLPTTVTDAAGQTTTLTYNSAGQISTITNAKSEVTQVFYNLTGDPSLSRNAANTGYLVAIDGPLAGTADSVSIAYDGYGRPRTITGTDGYAVTTDYDNLDRPTLVTYPDTTFEQIAYPRLEAEWMRDRLGRWTQIGYNSLRQVSYVQDSLQRVTSYIWCYCGALQQLTDAMGRVTNWTYNGAGQLTKKTYPGTAQAPSKEVNYTYDQAGRLKDLTDALNQKTSYKYYVDSSLKRVEFANAINPTSNVSFTYDSVYPRPYQMSDGTGTSTYVYNPITGTPTLGAGFLASIDGPLANDTVGYTYDALGRPLSRTINGAASQISVQYDALGRVDQIVNPLGTFGYGYVGATGRPDHIDYPNAQRTNFAYFGNSGDTRLQQIQNLKTAGGANLSNFAYTYNAVGTISTLTQQTDATAPQAYTYGYDQADQLRTAILKNATTGAAVHDYAYNYDDAGNRTSDQVDSTPRTFAPNHLNQVTSQTAGGPMRFSGTLNKPGTATVAGQPAQMAPGNQFSASITLSPGTQTVAVAGTDTGGKTTTQNFQVAVGNAGSRSFAYDANGNMTDNGAGQTYAWDAADRLVKITQAGGVTEFVYDGLSRRVQEKFNGTIIKQWVWCGLEMCEERNAANIVTKRFYAQGQQNGATNYYYTMDHLGSVREMTDSSGTVQARYDYDPYGRATKVSGVADADFQYTGHYYHAASGLNLAPFRAYDANLGRWLSRDPMREEIETNLYRYVSSNPPNGIDPLGLWQVTISAAFWVGGSISFGYNGGRANAGYVAGFGMGLSGNFNPNDNPGPSMQGWAGTVGASFDGSIGVPQMIEAGYRGEISTELELFKKCSRYSSKAALGGGLSNMYLGGYSGEAGYKIEGIVEKGITNEGRYKSSDGWNATFGGSFIVGFKGNLSW